MKKLKLGQINIASFAKLSTKMENLKNIYGHVSG